MGPIPDSPRFAGALLPQAIAGGTLHRCPSCALWFRHPRLSRAQLNQLYANGSERAWASGGARRPDWSLALDLLHRFKPKGNVLDVGCFDGELLLRLGAGYQRFGVEMNPKAAQRARARGVTVLEHDFDQLAQHAHRFDAIIATDVIEHMEDPGQFLQRCASLLAPGGLMLMSTGSTDAWNWRLMKGGYWYCANAEHLSFLNESWVRRASARLSLETLTIERFAHDVSAFRSLSQLVENLFYRFAPALLAGARRVLARDTHTRERADLRRLPPSWSTAKDHMMFALRRAN